MASKQPHIVVIDHTTGKVTVVGDKASAKGELASTLVEQAQAMKTAALGTPPPKTEE